jgi:hypothetical protein
MKHVLPAGKGPRRVRPLSVHLSLLHRTESRAKPFWTGKEWAQAVDPAVGPPAYPPKRTLIAVQVWNLASTRFVSQS